MSMISSLSLLVIQQYNSKRFLTHSLWTLNRYRPTLTPNLQWMITYQCSSMTTCTSNETAQDECVLKATHRQLTARGESYRKTNGKD